MGFSKLLRLAAVSATLITQGTLTAQTPGLSQSVAWNNAAVTFIAQTLDVTDTASAAGSLLARWRVGGVDKFTVSKAGAVTAGAASFTTGAFSGATLTLNPATGNANIIAQSAIGSYAYLSLAHASGATWNLQSVATTEMFSITEAGVQDCLTIAKTTGAAVFIGTLKSTGDFTVGASTFVVTAATGAVAITDGSQPQITMAKTGASALSSRILNAGTVVRWTDDTNGRTILDYTAATGAVILPGALAITGALTGATTLNMSGALTITVTADSRAAYIAAASSGDQFIAVPRAAGSGVQLLSRNAADNAAAPMYINGSTVAIGTLAGVGTRTVVVDANGVLSAP